MGRGKSIHVGKSLLLDYALMCESQHSTAHVAETGCCLNFYVVRNKGSVNRKQPRLKVYPSSSFSSYRQLLNKSQITRQDLLEVNIS